MVIFGGLRFQKQGDGGLITVHDGTAENAEVLRQVHLTREDLGAIYSEFEEPNKIKPRRPAKPAAARAVKKGK